ncbi:MAG TPA: PqqD family protein [Smithella sp.]|nr:PqqD family protein [Smithella sp.]
MKTQITLDAVYKVSGDVVVRELESEIIIFPIAYGFDDSENEPCILNSTGQIIWQKLNGRSSLKDIVKDLAAEFKAPAKVIEKDVIEFAEKLLTRKMLIDVSGI